MSATLMTWEVSLCPPQSCLLAHQHQTDTPDPALNLAAHALTPLPRRAAPHPRAHVDPEQRLISSDTTTTLVPTTPDTITPVPSPHQYSHHTWHHHTSTHHTWHHHTLFILSTPLLSTPNRPHCYHIVHHFTTLYLPTHSYTEHHTFTSTYTSTVAYPQHHLNQYLPRYYKHCISTYNNTSTFTCNRTAKLYNYLYLSPNIIRY